MMEYITFALAKGRLAKHTLSLLEKIGITCEEMKDEKTRKLIFVNEELGFKFLRSIRLKLRKMPYVCGRTGECERKVK